MMMDNRFKNKICFLKIGESELKIKVAKLKISCLKGIKTEGFRQLL